MVGYLADPAIPRTSTGLMELCGGCQREMFFRGGFIAMLAWRLKKLAKYAPSREKPASTILDRPEYSVADVEAALIMGDVMARRRLMDERWPEGIPICPKCGSRQLYEIGRGPTWRCKTCKYDFSILSQTNLAHPKQRLQVYLAAIYAWADGRHLMSAYEFSQLAKLQLPTGWKLKQRIESGWK
jgi:ribosomal protein L37AE/L43A